MNIAIKEDKKVSNSASTSTLILVHPGGLFGSTFCRVGYDTAEYHQRLISQHLCEHTGDFVVIDGSLSDEIPRWYDEIIADCLLRAQKREEQTATRHKTAALRLWGCDSGEGPYGDWQAFGDRCFPDVFDHQGAAASAIAKHIRTPSVWVTGAWASDDNRSGCVNHVVDVIRSQRPDLSAEICTSALYDD